MIPGVAPWRSILPNVGRGEGLDRPQFRLDVKEGEMTWPEKWKAQMRPGLKVELRPEVEVEVRAELKAELRAELEGELRPKILAKLEEELRPKIGERLREDSRVGERDQ